MWKAVGCWGQRTSRCTPGETWLAVMSKHRPDWKMLIFTQLAMQAHWQQTSRVTFLLFGEQKSPMIYPFQQNKIWCYLVIMISIKRVCFLPCELFAWQQRVSLTRLWGRDPEKYPHSQEIRDREIGGAGGFLSPLRIPCWQRHFVFLCLVGCELPQVWQAAGVMGDVWQMHISSLERR